MGKRLTQIATRTGDDGTTGLGDGTRVAKDHLRVQAMGDVDELNSNVGVLLAEPLPDEVRELLVVVGGLYHGLNGLRVALTSFGIGVARQRALFYGLLALVVVASALFALRNGDESGVREVLAALFPACREAGFHGFSRQPPAEVAKLVAFALREHIEPDYARALARVRQLPAPSPDAADWPWPLSIRTLGAFELRRHGEPVVSKGKAQRKPLELLKATIAHGARRVDAAKLTSQLWPDAEGDDAKASFDSTLYRLRKLCGVEGAIVLAEGKLSLDPASVWIDAVALDALLDEAPAPVDRALVLARGDFLADEGSLPWAARERDRLKARLMRAVVAAAGDHEARGDFGAARALYEAALERDNLAEAVYRRLMVCQRELGDAAGALVTYRRCRELLSIVLGRAPGAETEAVRRTLPAS
jgi:DNA-binding SARP family transcriptional activator